MSWYSSPSSSHTQPPLQLSEPSTSHWRTNQNDFAQYLASLDDSENVQESGRERKQPTAQSEVVMVAGNLTRHDRRITAIPPRAVVSTAYARNTRQSKHPTSSTLDDFALPGKLQGDEIFRTIVIDSGNVDINTSFGYSSHHELSGWRALEKADEVAIQLAAQEEARKKSVTRTLDMEYASRLASFALEEEKRYAQLIEEIQSRNRPLAPRIINADGTLEDSNGKRAHPTDILNFEAWKQLFESAGLKMKKFHIFVNVELERRFEIAQENLQKQGRPSVEVKAFHGTAAPNIENIRTAGFKIGGIGGHRAAHGAGLGIGIYLAVSAATSVGYAAGCQKMFACRVLPGQTTATVMPYVPVPNEPDSYFSGAVYVVRRPELVLPAYMIEW